VKFLDKSNINIIHTGTTTVAITVEEGVIFAADRRVTESYSKKIAHKVGKKILEIDEHVITTIAGGVADAQFIVDQLRVRSKLYSMNSDRRIPIKSLANYASILLFSSRILPYIVELNLGGYDDFGPSLFTIDPLGSLTQEKYIARGSGSPYALGVIESRYNPKLSLDDALKLAVDALKSAIRWDLFTGEGIDVAYVTKEGIVFLKEEEIKKYL